MMTKSERLHERISGRAASVGIIGMGYVGLPLMLAACRAGFRVTGFDIDRPKVEGLRRGISPLAHIDSDSIAMAVREGLFDATADFTRIAACDIILICVPTPLGPNREPDMSYVEGTLATIAPHVAAGALVVLESTTYPGTTREIVRPALEARGLRSEHDIFIAYSPEREDPGNIDFTTSRIPKVVGADGERALALALAFYGSFVSEVVPVSSCDTAEAVKLTENIFRAVNIALVNELKTAFEPMGIDVFEVIEAAATKPFGYMPFYPGPGLGGHCIPIDPFYLTWKARAHGLTTRFIELAGEINHAMPGRVVERLAEAIDHRWQRGLNGSRILVLGVAYKKNVDDIRESPALVIIERLLARGAEVTLHDPHVEVIGPTRDHPRLKGWRPSGLSKALLEAQHAVLIVTDHDAIDWPLVAAASPVIVDSRNAIRKRGLETTRLVPA